MLDRQSTPAAPSPRGPQASGWGRPLALAALLTLLLLASAPFAVYAAVFGVRGLLVDLSSESRLFLPWTAIAAVGANIAISAHMLGGAVITFLALIQPIGALRRRFPQLHRIGGRVFLVGAALSALGGLLFIALRGTIGGPVMDLGFAAYGVCVLVAASGAVRAARRGDLQAHWRWALRAIVLALGSWIYRLHYGAWYLTTGGLGSAPDFSGPFDQINIFAFYVPYLLAVELYLSRRDAHARAQGSRAVR